MQNPSFQVEVDYEQLTYYLVLTILSIVASIFAYIYFMNFSGISKHDREEFNALVYNFIVERYESNSDSDRKLKQQLV